jgi:predicted acylesterase/phospholipase RssA/CRP-like cAMP-binding protein
MISSLNSIAAFEGSDPTALRRVEEQSERMRLHAGEVVSRQGDRDDALYVVLSGSLQVVVALPRGRRHLRPLEAGEIDGEAAVLFQQPRSATLAADADTELLKIPATALHELFNADPPIHRRFLDFASRRLLNLHLALVPLFENVDLTIIDHFEGEGHWRHLAGGETLFMEGDSPDYLYVVVHGRLEVLAPRRRSAHVASAFRLTSDASSTGSGIGMSGAPARDDEGEDGVVARIGPGDCVGEMALLSGEPRSATVRAIRDSTLARLSKNEFDLLLQRNPAVVTTIARTLVSRLQETTAALAPTRHPATIALVPCGRDGFPPEFVNAFLGALSGVAGPTLHVDTRRLDLELGGRAAVMLARPDSHGPILSWLNTQEERFRHVVFESDAHPSPWTNLCARQADLVLLVASAHSDPRPGPIEEQLPQAVTSRHTPVHLVLVHGDERPPEGTSRWIEARRVDAYHHVRSGRAEDYSRLARAATGRAVGVVFGGGGARGYLHLGVVRALREAGIPIDAVGGTSIGALVAALCAQAMDTQAMIELATVGYGRKLGIGLLRDLTLPIVAFLSGRLAVKMLQDVFGHIHIEDLWLPYFCVSANLSTASVMVHERGPLWLGLRASLSIPGVLPPLLVNGELLVDGGLLDNLPVNVMRKRAGRVIAVDIASPVDLTVGSRSGTAASGWSQLWSRIGFFARQDSLPHIFEVLSRATMLGAIHNMDVVRNQADLYLHPIGAGVDTLDWTAGRTLIDVGYRYAIGEIDRWKTLHHL